MIMTLTPQLAGMMQDVARGHSGRSSFARSRSARPPSAYWSWLWALGGYTAGTRDCRQWAVQTASTMSAAIERDGPVAGRLWANLVANSDLVAEMVECRKTTVQ
jgi:hypothetical protein